jgi:chromosome segregation ATPase
VERLFVSAREVVFVKIKRRGHKFTLLLRGKQEIFVAQAKENMELKEELAKFTEERKKFEEEIRSLKSAMAPAEDETENTRELSTRAEFVARVRKLGDYVIAGGETWLAEHTFPS